MKKIMILILLLCVCVVPKVYAASAEEEIYVKVIYSSINVFEDTDINYDFNQDGENLDIITTYKYNQKLLVLQSGITGNDGYCYYKVKFELGAQSTVGYVLASQVLPANIFSPIKVFEGNAKINKTCKIYSLENQIYIETEEVLTAGQEIKILSGYNSSNKYTRIQYKDAEHNVLTAYVETANIETSGISKSTIGAIIIIITTVSLVLIVFGIKGKKKKKRVK